MATAAASFPTPECDDERDLRLVLAFVNAGCCSLNPLSDPAAADCWFSASGLPPDAAPCNASDLVDVRILQALLRRMLNAFRAKVAIGAADIEQLNAVLACETVHSELRHMEGQYRLQKCAPVVNRLQIQARLAAAVAKVIVDSHASRLRKCLGCDCLFYDQSKNQTRQWCSMRRCGNRAKASAYYQRQQLNGGA